MTVWREDPVPQEWRGLWRRLALERPDGSGDITSQVLWLQTESLFVDVRIPADRPVVSGFHADLSRQEGFAGRVRHDGDCVQWLRRIDYRPLGVPDEGRVRREGRMLVERGLHEPYVEHWWQVEDGADTEVIADTERCIIVRAGDHLMLAEERRPSAPANLVAAVEDPGALALSLDCEITYARRAATGWCIAASTLPWREGRVLTARDLQKNR